MRSDSAAATDLPDRLARRPDGLLSLCLTEILERYGSFLIAALLPLFLNEQKHLEPTRALRVVGLYLALGYAGGVGGGLLADRWLGYRGATRLGALLMLLGAVLLTSAHPGTLYPALVLLILGTSFFKPSLPAWLGSLYEANDPRHGAGYLWLYFAANIGTLLAPFIGGALRTRHSWPLAFATTVVAYALCLITIVVSQRNASPAPAQTHSGAARERKPGLWAFIERWRPMIGLFLVMMLFCIAYGQSGGALLFFARDQVNRQILGYVIPPDFFASVPSLLVLFLILPQQWLMKKMARDKTLPPSTTPMLFGMLSSSIAFGLLTIVIAVHNDQSATRLSALWISGALIFTTLGEILVMPTAMALVAQSAPRGREGLAQGILALAMAVGLGLAGEAGRFLMQWGAPRFFAVIAIVPLVGVLILRIEARRWLRPS